MNEGSHFMTLATLGTIQISVTPLADNPSIMSVDVIAENRVDALAMKTNKDETVDQFTTRLKSMLRALLNAQPRNGAPVTSLEEQKPLTWEEQKAALKSVKK